MTSSNCDSDELTSSYSASSTESDSSEAETVEDSAQNVEPYQFEPAANNTSSSCLGSDTEVENKDSGDDERLHNTHSWL